MMLTWDKPVYYCTQKQQIFQVFAYSFSFENAICENITQKRSGYREHMLQYDSQADIL